MARRRRVARRLAGASAGIVADGLLGEPPSRAHPVAAFGALMGALERSAWRDSRGAGALHASAGVALAAAAGRALGSLPLATYLAVAGRALRDEARAVEECLRAGDVESARRRLPALVGRDAGCLDEKEVARAVVESVAENTVDALVAPVVWAVALGPGGALAYRAVNTLDAMFGRRDERYSRYGWASARLDDVCGWLPARVTAALVALVRPARAPEVWRAVARDSPAHPSPNAGVAEASFAAALGLRVGGPSSYSGRVEIRPQLGQGPPPKDRDIERAVLLCEQVATALAAMLAAPALAGVAWRAARRLLGGRR